MSGSHLPVSGMYFLDEIPSVEDKFKMRKESGCMTVFTPARLVIFFTRIIIMFKHFCIKHGFIMGQGGEAADGFKDFFNSRIVLVEEHGVESSPNGSLLLQEQPHLVMSRSSTLDLGVYGTKVDIMCPGEVSSTTKGPSEDSHGSNQETHPSVERLSRYLSPPPMPQFT